MPFITIKSSSQLLLIVAITPLLLTLLIWPTFNPLPYFSIFDGKRLMQIFSIGLILLFISLYTPARTLWLESYLSLSNIIKISLFALIFSAAITSFSAPSPRHSFLEIALFSGLFISSIYLAALAKQHPKTSQQIVLFIVITAVLLNFAHFTIEWGKALLSGNVTTFKTLFSNFANPRFFNQWQGIILPLLIAIPLIRPNTSKRDQILIWVLVSYLWAGIFFSGGRGVVLSLIIATLFTGWWLKSFRAKWWQQNFIGLVAGISFYWVINASLFLSNGEFLNGTDGVSRLLENTNSSGRVEIWTTALHSILNHPFFGIGGMHFFWQSETGFSVAHPHNIILQLLAEWGIPFTVLLLAITLLAFSRWLQGLQHQKTSLPTQWLHFALTNAFIVGNLHALVSGVWVMPISQLSLIAVIALMLAADQTQQRLNPAKCKPYQHRLLMIFGLITLLLLAYGIAPELKDLNNWLLQSLEEVGSTKFAPRFWVQGLIQ